MNTFRFLDFLVYCQAKSLYKRILKITSRLNNYSIKDQVSRASLSVVLNIAEGSAKKSDKEFFRFLQVAIGSINEVLACLDIMLDNNYLNKEEFDDLKKECEEVARQLGGFSKKLVNG